jgi:hypothetical protein
MTTYLIELIQLANDRELDKDDARAGDTHAEARNREEHKAAMAASIETQRERPPATGVSMAA